MAYQSDPTKFKILWNEIPDWSDTASTQAAQLAAAMNQQPPPPGGATRSIRSTPRSRDSPARRW